MKILNNFFIKKGLEKLDKKRKTYKNNKTWRNYRRNRTNFRSKENDFLLPKNRNAGNNSKTRKYSHPESNQKWKCEVSPIHSKEHKKNTPSKSTWSQSSNNCEKKMFVSRWYFCINFFYSSILHLIASNRRKKKIDSDDKNKEYAIFLYGTKIHWRIDILE